MTLVGLGFFIYCLSIVSNLAHVSSILLSDGYQGVYSAKYLYAQHVYTWTTAQVKRKYQKAAF
jgi:hypothetical protein